MIIGSVGSAEALPHLQRALKDEDGYVKSRALIGIQRAISGGRISPVNNGNYFEMVAGMWPSDTDFHVNDEIPTVLLKLHRERAIERLLQPDLFTMKFEPIWRILDALAAESVEVPRPRLIALIKEAEEDPVKHSRTLGGAVALLGMHRMEEDLDTLERFIDHPNDRVSAGATKGLYAYHRYDELIRDPWDVVRATGWDSLTEAEKHVLAVQELDAEVKNGGFAQYYFNSWGNHWKEALNGLTAIGATKRSKLMAATIDKFGQSQPSTQRDSRGTQLSAVVRKKEDPFKEQDNAWYETDDEPLERLICRYNLANMKGREKAK